MKSSSSSTTTKQPLSICITGSSSGIGLAAARRLILEGHTVYHACRNEKRAQDAVKAAGGGIPMVCDLADLPSVQQFANCIKKLDIHLDVLCLNAGAAMSTTPRWTRQGFEESIGVNHIGHFLLANLLYPMMKGGRIVITASKAHDPAAINQTARRMAQGGSWIATAGGWIGTGVPQALNIKGLIRMTLGNLEGFGLRIDNGKKGPIMTDGSLEYNAAKAFADSKICNLLFASEAARRLPELSCLLSFNPGFIPETGLHQWFRDYDQWKARWLTWQAWLDGYSVPVEVAGARLVYLATMNEREDQQRHSYYSADVKARATTMEEGFRPVFVSREAADEELAGKLWDRTEEVVHEWMKL